MADRIKMDTEQLERWADQLAQVSGALSRAEAALRRVDTGDDWWRKVRMSRSIRLKDAGRTVNINGGRDAVRELIGAIDLYQSRTKKLQSMLDRNVGVFEGAENEVQGLANGLDKGSESSVYNVAKQFSGAFADILKFHGDYDSWTDVMRKEYDQLIERFASYYINSDGDYVFTGTGISAIIGANGFLKSVSEHGFKKLKAFSGTREYFEGGGYAENKVELGFNLFKGGVDLKKGKTNLWEDSEKKRGDSPEREFEVFTVGLSASEKAAIGHWEGSKKTGWGEGSYSSDFGYAEAHGGISGGFYITRVGEDGKERRVFEPGVQAEIGASVGLWQGKAEGRLGNEYVAVVGETSASVLEANAQAEMNLGFVDGELAANVSASAEATLVEAEGKVGVDVMGVEGTIGGSVNVGVGAHAEVGYNDGKLTFDIGASLGVGASISAEVDVSGLVDGVSNAVEDISNAASDFADTAREAADDFVDAAQEKCEAAVDFLVFWA